MARADKKITKGGSGGENVLDPNARIFGGQPKDYSLTLAKGMALLEMFASGTQEITSQTAAEKLQTSRASARRLILTLEAMGYLDKSATGYRLTSRCLGISRAFLTGNSILGILTERVRDLSARIDCPCSIVSLNGADVMFLCRDPSRRVFASQLSLGDRVPAHASSGGKLLLAQKSPDAISQWFKTYQPRQLTPRTIVTAAGMIEERQKIARQGYAISEEELEAGLVSLSMPIRDHTGAVKLGLVISQFASQMDREALVREFLEPLTSASEQLSQLYADFLVHQS